MRSAFVIMLLTVSAFAQQESSAPAACGSRNIQFEMKRDESQHSIVPPDPGMARVYFIQDIGRVNCIAGCSTKIGLDGKWIGANQHNSYISVSVEPGEHHMCVSLSPHFSPHAVALAHFTAEAGQVYYFRVRPFWAKDELLTLDPVDADEGKYLVSYYPLRVSHPKP